MAKEQTLGQKMRVLQASIFPTFKSVFEKEVTEVELVNLRTKIVQFQKLGAELRAAFDHAVDMRDSGQFGEDFAPTVTRIREKSDKVGRPKSVKKDELAELDI